VKKIIFILTPLFLLAANLSIKVNKKTLNIGEELIITISAKGHDIKFPTLTNIAGIKIVGTSSSNNISIINGVMKEIVTRSYILYPKKDFTIPPLSVYIDGKEFKTKPINIKVTTPKQTKGDYELYIKISKNNLYLGESAIFTIKFIQKKPAASIQIQKPQIKGFLLKEINANEKDEQNKKILTYKFLAIAQKSGNYKIGPLLAQIGHIVKTNDNDFFGLQIASFSYESVYSNTLKLKVKPIPKESIFGDFNISIKAQKNIVNEDEVNKITLKIIGCGDFYSIPKFKLNIPNSTIYSNKPIKSFKIENSKLCGEFIEEFKVISNKSYKIPSFSLKTFDGKLHVIKTKPIKIKVINITKTLNNSNQILNTKQKTNPVLNDTINKNFIFTIIISLIIGIIIGALLFYIFYLYKNSLYKKIKNADEKELLNILKKYENNKKIKEIMQKIEENIYKNANNKVNKKEIYKIIKKI